MGGAVSSGRDNNELIDNLMGGNYIRTRCVERVFRALDRAEYMTPEARDQAYKDLAWRNGPLHLSAPCIYSEVMEGLELHPGLSFLNVGSGTGYLSTLVGLIIGSSGISHGIEVHPMVVEYANKKLGQFIENSATLDEFDFCDPKYYCGNGLCLAPLQSPYDRVYCGAGCPEEYQNYFKQLIKVGGVLVMPLNDSLVQVRRVSDTEWTSRSLLSVSFATLKVPTREETADLIKLEEQTPVRLQILSRAVVRSAMRRGLVRRHPELREPPPRPAPAKKRCPRRICIPIEDDSDVEGLNALHDLDRTNGATEMNALLSLVLSMGQNRVAGALRFDSLDSPTDSDSNDDDDDDTPPEGEADPTDPSASEDVDEPGDDAPNSGDAGGSGDGDNKTNGDDSAGGSTKAAVNNPSDDTGPKTSRSCRGILTLEFHEDSADSTKTKSRTHTATTSNDSGADSVLDSAGDTPDLGELGGVPAEVEIYLGKEVAGTSREADMEWEDEIEEEEETNREDSTDEESGEETTKVLKRKKLDSGIGDGTSTSSGGSPRSATAPALQASQAPQASQASQDPLVTFHQRIAPVINDQINPPDEGPRQIVHRLVNNDQVRGRRRLTRRTRSLRQSSSSTECSDGADAEAGSGQGAGASCARPCVKRRAPPQSDARRVRLSIVMKRGVKELPLPYALKKYVNLGRCFEF